MINRTILQHCYNEGFSEEELYGAYKIFLGTLVSEPRLKIINLLRKGKKNVSEIMSVLKMDQTFASHNLSRLKQCGFVLSEIEGKFRYYKLNEETIKPLVSLIDCHMSKYCIHILKSIDNSVKPNILSTEFSNKTILKSVNKSTELSTTRETKNERR